VYLNCLSNILEILNTSIVSLILNPFVIHNAVLKVQRQNNHYLCRAVDDRYICISVSFFQSSVEVAFKLKSLLYINLWICYVHIINAKLAITPSPFFPLKYKLYIQIENVNAFYLGHNMIS
jgi:hypothetical protein